MKVRSWLFGVYIAALVIYSCFTLIPAPDPLTLLRYHISATGLRLLDVSIIVLLVGIWFAGFYGYTKLQEYSKLIQADKDGKQIAWLTKGLLLLVLWLPVSEVASSILNYYALKHPGSQAAATIIDNYLNLLFPLVGFVLIGIGARGLTRLTRFKPTFWMPNLLYLGIIYVGLIYYRLMVTTHGRAQVYHLSIWMMLLTLAAPYIFMWSTGLVATYELYRYQHKVAGVVYRRSWDMLALGLGWLIVTTILFQYLTTLVNRLSSLSIYWVLAIVYSVLAVLSVGFILIALGAKKLKKIEEV
ncbi:MAG TPA: hypothetical protein VLG27_01480 [Candidatus Saccharimonadia bacterium]|nr:hypothetical protein [Candidatus Saccharimonadia bacterium]